MIVALLSDIHANLEALQAVLADMEQRGVKQAVGLGDYIGFNGNPAECLSLVQPLLTAAVRGNHEEALYDRNVFAVPMYRRMMDLTREMLSPEQLAWLRSLPPRMEWEECILSHATPEECKRWGRVVSLGEARRVFAATKARICFHGHTHRCTVFRLYKGQVEKIPVEYDANGSFLLHMPSKCRFLVNPGSVGQPRDLDWRASYGLFCPETSTLHLRRVAYDVHAAQSKVSRTGLPATFADALRSGDSPTGD